MEKLKRGRKPVQDKKKPVTIYVAESIINSIGVENLKGQMLQLTKKTQSK